MMVGYCIRKRYKKKIQKMREQCWKFGLDLRYAGPSQDEASTEDSWQTCRANAGAEGAESVGKYFSSFITDVK